MRWPLCLRSTLDAMRLRLVAEKARGDDPFRTLEVTSTELRRHRLLVAALTKVDA